MKKTAVLLLLCGVSAGRVCSAADEVPRLQPSLTLQTGVASTFQLTLGGTFGGGPAWQNRAIVELGHVIGERDALVVTGWMTRDHPSGRTDWISGIAYRLPQWTSGSNAVSATVGWQRWLFPTVLCGAKDHLASFNVALRTRWKVPINVTADDWVLLKSPLRKGNLLHVQANAAHTLWTRRALRFVLRHGPSTTYSWNFYDRPGWRVLRYGGSAALEARKWSLEGAVRQQAAIAPRVPDNRYFSLILTRRL